MPLPPGRPGSETEPPAGGVRLGKSDFLRTESLRPESGLFTGRLVRVTSPGPTWSWH